MTLRSSRIYWLLLTVFVLACGLGYTVVRDAVKQTVEHQALVIAEVVASQATTTRSVYASEIADKLKKDGFGPHEDSVHQPGYVPIPAQFLKLVGLASSLNSDKLYEYKPVSKWNLEVTQGLNDDFLKWAWPQLESQNPNAPSAAVNWTPISRIETQNGQRILRYLSADPAAQISCVNCHNAHEKTPAIRALRLASGIEEGKQWKQHQLLGALSVTIPLSKSELLAGGPTNEATLFFAAILIASFMAMWWFNWRLSRQTRNLLEAESQLAKSEVQAQSAQALLLANQGVEQAFSELSTYMQAIDQHALVSVTDHRGRILRVNDKLVEISGFTRDELLGQDHRLLNSGTHDPAFFAHLWDTIENGEIWRGLICNRTKFGQIYWVDSAIVPLKGASQNSMRYVSIRVDVTERIKNEDEMRHMATHDGLTKLANRALLRDRIHQALESNKRLDKKSAVLFIDLDQFKIVNDSLGHDIGDLLLIEVAARLTSCVRTEDTVARQGGDEFIVFMPRINEAADSCALAAKLQAALAHPFQIDGRELFIGSSIGIAVSPQSGNDVDSLLKNSDIAMYQVKSTGRNHFLLFDSDMNQFTLGQYSIGTDLRRAMERGELFLNYQPIVGLASGETESMEVLLRWQHPQHGLVPPDQFIPLAESLGLIISIGGWVMRTACQQVRTWQLQGYQVPRLAINLSALQIHHQEAVRNIEQILMDSGIDPHDLELEITEGSLMKNTDEVVSRLEQLSARGLHISLDDFGTGYSSLSYLKRLPIDTLKIDRSFVSDIGDDPNDTAIVATIIAMGHSLGMKVIAEGVETPEQLAFLKAQGCQQYQGYLYSRPLSASDMESRLKRV